MKNYKLILLMALGLTIGSCASNYEEDKHELLAKDENTDLVSSFDAQKAEAEIFTPNVEEPVAPENKISYVKPTAANAKKAAKKETAKKAIKSETPVVAASTSPAAVVPAIPADYPEEYKAYDAKSKQVWAKFNPVFFAGEQSIMAVTYLGATAGYITISSKEMTSLNNKPAYHFFARLKSSDSYKFLYWLDDKLDSYVEKSTFLPMKYSLVQREKKQNVDDLQLFDFKKMMTYNWYKRVKEGSNKDEKGEAKIPRYAQDSFSALQFVRGLPLEKGDQYEFPVITRGKFWILKVDVLGEETVSIMGKDIKAIKIKAETNFPGVLKKSGDINFWYSADAEKRFLKFQAKIKLGSIYGELVEYKPGTKAQ